MITQLSRPADARAAIRQIEEQLLLRDEDASELVLVRHAEPAAWSAPFPGALTQRGTVQARRLAAALSSLWVEAIYTAPAAAAFETASTIRQSIARLLEEIDDLRDIDCVTSPAAGLAACGDEPAADLFNRRPRWDSLPGLEPSLEFRRRAIVALNSVLERHPGRRIVVVTHASVINAYLSMLLDIPRDLFFQPDYGSISIVRSLGELYAVRSLNETSHLRSLVLTDSA